LDASGVTSAALYRCPALTGRSRLWSGVSLPFGRLSWRPRRACRAARPRTTSMRTRNPPRGALRGLAEFLMRKPELSDIRIIRANINLEPLDRIAARHGFEAIRDPIKPSIWERVHQFGENILFFLLVLACNPRGAARLKNFSRRRQLLYLSRRVCDSKELKRSGVCCSANWQSPR